MKDRALIVLSMVLGMGIAGIAYAQPESEPESENVGHTRHHHPHNPKHETDDDASRFYTDRDSPVEIPLPSEDDAFSFVIFGDRTGGPDTGVSVLADAVRDTNLLEPDFVMTVGDMIDGYNESAQWMEEMHEFRAIMDRLLCPWFPVAGNHDIYWRNQGSGEQRPPNEHEDRYELHFGPLWYAFRHKNNHFIVLYTDEPNPDTGERNFNKPASQKMSPEQRGFLREALEMGQDAEHTFVFVHHPRWLKGRYGDDWDSVHEMLVGAGNVAAVFAGHIHYMRYDGPTDGIEYVSLATVGGGQSGVVPQAGFLHQLHLVTVREGQIAMAALPVGGVMDVRDITGELATQANTLARAGIEITGRLEAGSGAGDQQPIAAKLKNPTDFPVEFTLAIGSHDEGWSFPIDHVHGTLEPRAERTIELSAHWGGQRLDERFNSVEVRLDRAMITKSFRYTIPTRTIEAPTRLRLRPELVQLLEDRALRTSDGSWASIDSSLLPLHDGPMTLECWFRADHFKGRTGLLAKTESSEYGFFVTNGRPQFSIFLGDRYVEPITADPVLEPDRWHHIAGVYDGAEVRLYLDGELMATQAGSGSRRTNAFPLMIGADVNAQGEPTSFFNGRIDNVRLSSIARYTGTTFTPERTHKSDSDTLALLPMNATVAKWTVDESTNDAHATMRGDAELVEP